jgi:hypothetical protein
MDVDGGSFHVPVKKWRLISADSGDESGLQFAGYRSISIDGPHSLPALLMRSLDLAQFKAFRIRH